MPAILAGVISSSHRATDRNGYEGHRSGPSLPQTTCPRSVIRRRAGHGLSIRAVIAQQPIYLRAASKIGASRGHHGYLPVRRLLLCHHPDRSFRRITQAASSRGHCQGITHDRHHAHPAGAFRPMGGPMLKGRSRKWLSPRFRPSPWFTTLNIPCSINPRTVTVNPPPRPFCPAGTFI